MMRTAGPTLMFKFKKVIINIAVNPSNIFTSH